MCIQFLGLLLLGFACGKAAAGPAYRLVPIVARGLDEPVGVETAPGEPGRLYVVERAGRIVAVEGDKPVAGPPFLDIRDRVATDFVEMGLLGLAFHPGYAKNKRFFVKYTAMRPKRVAIVAEYKAGSRDEKEILRYSQPYENHNGGPLAFGPDGLLYIGTGDGGSAGDPQGNGQNPKALLGKILRVDVDRGAPYGIPPDNPFADGKAGAPEVYAWGLRNPWRISFDGVTGLLFAADVGQWAWEEIDVIVKGGNYGWNRKEGAHCFKSLFGCGGPEYRDPVHEYSHREGISITGGYVYRGKKIPGLVGAYVYGDYGSGRIWALRFDPKTGGKTGNELLLRRDVSPSSFGVDGEGELLVVSHRGPIYRLQKN